jgi:hypothetical protein
MVGLPLLVVYEAAGADLLGLLVGVQRREVPVLQVVVVGLPLLVVYEVAGADLLGLLVGFEPPRKRRCHLLLLIDIRRRELGLLVGIQRREVLFVEPPCERRRRLLLLVDVRHRELGLLVGVQRREMGPDPPPTFFPSRKKPQRTWAPSGCCSLLRHGTKR